MAAPDLRIHYGDHAGTTGRHLADAARKRCRSETLACSRHEHVHHKFFEDQPYLWVESGYSSYPIGTWNSKAPTACYLIDVHQHLHLSLKQAVLFDVVFVAQLDYVARISKVHPSVHWLPLAAPSWFCTVPREPTFDVGFVGRLGPDGRRESILRHANRYLGMNDWRRRYSVEEMAEVYARSRFVINPPVNGDVNMRFFEALAAGALVVSPTLANGLPQIARAGEHFLSADFSSSDGPVEAIRRVRGSPDEARIASAGRDLVRRKHTYEHRIERVLRVLLKAPLLAPVRAMSSRERADRMLAVAVTIHDQTLMATALRLRPTPSVKLLTSVVGTTARTVKRRLEGVLSDPPSHCSGPT